MAKSKQDKKREVPEAEKNVYVKGTLVFNNLQKHEPYDVYSCVIDVSDDEFERVLAIDNALLEAVRACRGAEEKVKATKFIENDLPTYIYESEDGPRKQIKMKKHAFTKNKNGDQIETPVSFYKQDANGEFVSFKPSGILAQGQPITVCINIAPYNMPNAIGISHKLRAVCFTNPLYFGDEPVDFSVVSGRQVSHSDEDVPF